MLATFDMRPNWLASRSFRSRSPRAIFWTEFKACSVIQMALDECGNPEPVERFQAETDRARALAF
jgi:hypothetical protein